MRRATGPGRIDSLPTPPSPPAIVSGLLYNFVIDDSTVKTEHVLWLELFVVPLLRTPGVQIGLRGTSSRSGSATYNKQLSDRRVEAVKKHLISRGAPPAAFQSVGVGETDALVAGEKRESKSEAPLLPSLKSVAKEAQMDFFLQWFDPASPPPATRTANQAEPAPAPLAKPPAALSTRQPSPRCHSDSGRRPYRPCRQGRRA